MLSFRVSHIYYLESMTPNIYINGKTTSSLVFRYLEEATPITTRDWQGEHKTWHHVRGEMSLSPHNCCSWVPRTTVVLKVLSARVTDLRDRIIAKRESKTWRIKTPRVVFCFHTERHTHISVYIYMFSPFFQIFLMQIKKSICGHVCLQVIQSTWLWGISGVISRLSLLQSWNVTLQCLSATMRERSDGTWQQLPFLFSIMSVSKHLFCVCLCVRQWKSCWLNWMWIKRASSWVPAG